MHHSDAYQSTQPNVFLHVPITNNISELKNAEVGRYSYFKSRKLSINH